MNVYLKYYIYCLMHTAYHGYYRISKTQHRKPLKKVVESPPSPGDRVLEKKSWKGQMSESKWVWMKKSIHKMEMIVTVSQLAWQHLLSQNIRTDCENSSHHDTTFITHRAQLKEVSESVISVLDVVQQTSGPNNPPLGRSFSRNVLWITTLWFRILGG